MLTISNDRDRVPQNGKPSLVSHAHGRHAHSATMRRPFNRSSELSAFLSGWKSRPLRTGNFLIFFLVLGLFALATSLFAQSDAPPPVAVDNPDPTPAYSPILSHRPPPSELSAIGRASGAAIGVYTWTEDAESGLAEVLDSTAAAYSLIQSDIAAQGSNAFHLAHPAPSPNWFTLDVDILVQTDTKLFFQSRLGYATSGQTARVQLSTDGGSTWPANLYSQGGDGTSGEGVFVLREIDLGSTYDGQLIRLRFHYDFISGSYYFQTDSEVGWLIDDIQIGPTFLKTLRAIGNPTASEVAYLEIINRARVNALIEANRLANIPDPTIQGVYTNRGITAANIIAQFQWYVGAGACMDQFAQPLAFHPLLLETSQKHSQDMFNNIFQGHVSSSNPLPPFQAGDTFANRLGRVGYSSSSAFENAFAYSESVEYGHAGLDVDWGSSADTSSPCYNSGFVGQGMQNPSGHRRSIHKAAFNEVGIGVINGTNGGVGPQIVTQNFGINSGASYITGVIYDDNNMDGIYTATSDALHEGRGGIRVDVDGSGFYTQSTASGAYAFPVTSDGSYTVTFSGAGIQTFVTTATITGGNNTKLDHHPVALTGYPLFASTHSLTGGPLDDDEGDTIANLIEYVVVGMAPTTLDSGLLPTFLLDGADNKMRYTLNKRAGTTDVLIVLLISTNLLNWESAAAHSSTTVEVDDAGQLIVSVNPGVTKIFATLEVTHPAP
jgi:uncharacterized protein YkwD